MEIETDSGIFINVIIVSVGRTVSPREEHKDVEIITLLVLNALFFVRV